MSLKLQYNSPVVLSFSLSAIIVFLLDKAFQGTLMPFFTLYPLFDAANPISYFRLFSHALGHASLDHLLSNLTFLLLVGPVIEEKYGSVATFLMLLITALSTAILHLILFQDGLLGASGLVFMCIILTSFTNVKGGYIPVTFIIITFLYLGKEIADSMDSTDNVSQFAHIVGGVAGGIFGLLLNNKQQSAQDLAK